MAQDAGLEFSRADVVVSISRGPLGQWFPETEHWASAIFVGTSGIPPKLNYRSVKSYNSYFLLAFFFVRGQVQMMCLVWHFSLVHLTIILSQLKMSRLHEHDDTSNNVSNFFFQNFVWAAGRCFLFICFAFWKHRIFT